MRQTVAPPTQSPRLRVSPRFPALPRLAQLLSRGLPAGVQISLRRRWPLALLFLTLAAQLLMPDPVWSTTAILLGLLYLGGWLWLRAAARGVTLMRTHSGALLVVGDRLEEEWVASNRSFAPLPWLEVRDGSTLPDYAPGRVVCPSARSSQRWRTTALCTQRGRFRIGPHTLAGADPFSLFALTFTPSDAAEIVIFPRAALLPALPLPRGDAGGEARARRPLFGVQPAAAVREWLPQDDLRFVHWPTSARKNALMVRELEVEPTGDLWVLLDSCAATKQPIAPSIPPAPPLPPNTLEFAISVAAGVAATLHSAARGRGVGLVAASGEAPEMLILPPRRGVASLWTIPAALAPLAPSSLRLSALLQQVRALLPSRSSLLVVTADLTDPAEVEGWIARLVGLRERGMNASALLLTLPATESAAQNALLLLARNRIEAQLLPADSYLPAALTQRRRRTVVRSSPLGRAVTVEVEEDVG